MDPDIWNSYHIMTNRARAVCYSVRQQQFRGLTEMTVNKLMHTGKNIFNFFIINCLKHWETCDSSA